MREVTLQVGRSCNCKHARFESWYVESSQHETSKVLRNEHLMWPDIEALGCWGQCGKVFQQRIVGIVEVLKVFSVAAVWFGTDVNRFWTRTEPLVQFSISDRWFSSGSADAQKFWTSSKPVWTEPNQCLAGWWNSTNLTYFVHSLNRQQWNVL